MKLAIAQTFEPEPDLSQDEIEFYSTRRMILEAIRKQPPGNATDICRGAAKALGLHTLSVYNKVKGSHMFGRSRSQRGMKL